MAPTPWAFTGLGLVASAAAFGFTALVLRTAPRRVANRRVAAVLAVEGLLNLLMALAVVPEDGSLLSEALWGLLAPVMVFAPWVYLRFLATLDTPLVRPFRGRLLWVVLALPATVYGAVLAHNLGLAGWVDINLFRFVAAPGIVFVFLFAIAASVSAARRAPRGSPARARATAYAAAFITRDAFLLGFFAIILLAAEFHIRAAIGIFNSFEQINPIAIAALLYTPLLAYGILRTQLFDIDIKLKRGLRDGTLTAIFVVAFFLAEQAGQQLISDQAGPFVGIAGAGAIALAFAPVRRFASKVANIAMPHTDNSATYIAARKMQVYRAALEGAYEDGSVTEKERAVLTHLAAELGIAPDDMVAIEAEVREARVATPGVAPASEAPA